MKKNNLVVNKIFLVFIILLTSQSFFAQTKFDEYEKIDSDSESARIDAFLSVLNNQPESKGLIVIYTGANKERLGSILAYVEGAKRYFGFRNIEQNKVIFKIAEGNNPLSKELWIISAGQSIPQIKSLDVGAFELKNKYLYASTCLDCEPVVPELRSDGIIFDHYIEKLKSNENFRALIVINQPSGDKMGKVFAREIEKRLIKKEKINKNRIQFEFVKQNRLDSTIAAFYIVPKTKK